MYYYHLDTLFLTQLQNIYNHVFSESVRQKKTNLAKNLKKPLTTEEKLLIATLDETL